MHRLLTHKKVRFGLIGGLNTAIDFGVFTILTINGVPTIVANTVSTSLGMISSFFLNRRFTFKSTSGKQHIELVQFLAVTLVGLWILQPLIIYGFRELLQSIFTIHGHTVQINLVGKLLSIFVSLCWNFVWYNSVVFKDRNGRGDG